jgi:hypothetical protein
MRRCHPDQSDRPVLLDVLWWPGRTVPVRPRSHGRFSLVRAESSIS